MKKMKTWMMMLIMIMTAGILTSCEEDNKLAFRLGGDWRGDFGMNYTMEYRGRLYTFDSYDTYLVFYNDGIASTHGWGKQVDYYDFGPYEYQYYRFNWRIRDGIIYISYPAHPELEVSIYDYKMSWGHFTGWFDDSDVRFDLRKLVDTDYDWDYYRNDYAYGYNNSWSWGGGYYPYYSKTRAGMEGVDNEEVGNAGTEEFRVVGIGNRYMNNLNKEE